LSGLSFCEVLSTAADVGRLEALWPLDAFELYRFAFVECAIAVPLDGGEVHKHVLAG